MKNLPNFLIFAAVLGLGYMYLSVGQWLMIAALLLIICGHELGHWLPARLFGFNVPTFSIGFGSPALRIGRLWGTDFQITPWLAGGYVQINPNDDEFINHAPWKRSVVLLGGVTMNLIMAVVLLIGAFAFIGKPVPHIGVAHVLTAEAPAAKAGLHDGDVILSVDSTPIRQGEDVPTLLAKHQDGSSASILIERNGQKLTVTVRPENGKIGVQLGQKLSYEPQSLPEAAKQGVIFTGTMIKTQISGIGMAVGLVTPPPGADTRVHGIVGIVQMGGMAAQQGVFQFIWMCAALNIVLMIFNILPIGVLDGGHLAYIAYEKVTGRRVPIGAQNVIAIVSLALILTLTAYGLYNDFAHPVPRL